MIEPLPRWAVVDGTVLEHVQYGLLVRVPSGEVGVLDRSLISDEPIPIQGWPAVGQVIAVVGAGYTSAGQLRLSARPSHLAMAHARARESGN